MRERAKQKQEKQNDRRREEKCKRDGGKRNAEKEEKGREMESLAEGRAEASAEGLGG